MTHRNPIQRTSDERTNRIATLRSSQAHSGAIAKRSVNRRGSHGGGNHTVGMRMPRPVRTRVATVAVGSALALAACGGGGSSSEPAGSTLPALPDAIELEPAADNAANQLPDVVVDDIGAGNKVNLRNAAPAETPILLWMYAPH